MQFWLLANDPQLNGLYGLVEYLARYADEEYLRWYAQLCRHYCIEGKKDRFSTDPYMLDHISNPDFAQSTQSWILKPAQNGMIAPGKLGWPKLAPGQVSQNGGRGYLFAA